MKLAQAHDLPIEIVRDIFEFAAKQDRYTATVLDLVSSQVHEWMNPILYTTVVLDSANSLIPFAEIVRAAPDMTIPRLSPSLQFPSTRTTGNGRRTAIPRTLQFYASTVKYLSITHASIPFHHIRHLFISLTSVRTLELDTYFPFPPTSMKPIELITEGIGNPGLFTHPMFRNITRLWLCRPLAAFVQYGLTIGKSGSSLVSTLAYIAIPLRISTLPGRKPEAKAHYGDLKLLFSLLELEKLEIIVVNLDREHTVLSGRSAITEIPKPDPQRVWEDILQETLDERLLLRTPDELGKEPDEARREGVDLWTRAQRDGLKHPLLRK